jgi:ABC-type transporter Mla subunit MlaD
MVEQQIREAAATFQVTQRELTRTTGVLETATTNLSSASTDLRETGEMLRSCITEVRGATQAFQKAAEAQQQLGAQAEALAKLVADAAARFTGLDERLASVFAELSRGLEAFQKNVQHFVSGTDQGMAAAARHLLAAIDRLAEELEEHALRSTTQAGNQ